MELSVDQLAILAGVATVGVWILTAVWTGIFKQPKPSDNVLKIIVFVVALVFAYFWSGITLPDFSSDWMGFVGALLSAAVFVYKFAQLIYDYLWKKIVDGIKGLFA